MMPLMGRIRRRDRKRQGRKRRKNRQLVLEGVRASLLSLLRGQESEKIFDAEKAWGIWGPRGDQQSFQNNPTGSRTTPPC